MNNLSLSPPLYFSYFVEGNSYYSFIKVPYDPTLPPSLLSLPWYIIWAPLLRSYRVFEKTEVINTTPFLAFPHFSPFHGLKETSQLILYIILPNSWDKCFHIIVHAFSSLMCKLSSNIRYIFIPLISYNIEIKIAFKSKIRTYILL